MNGKSMSQTETFLKKYSIPAGADKFSTLNRSLKIVFLKRSQVTLRRREVKEGAESFLCFSNFQL